MSDYNLKKLREGLISVLSNIKVLETSLEKERRKAVQYELEITMAEALEGAIDNGKN